MREILVMISNLIPIMLSRMQVVPSGAPIEPPMLNKFFNDNDNKARRLLQITLSIFQRLLGKYLGKAKRTAESMGGREAFR